MRTGSNREKRRERGNSREGKNKERQKKKNRKRKNRKKSRKEGGNVTERVKKR